MDRFVEFLFELKSKEEIPITVDSIIWYNSSLTRGSQEPVSAHLVFNLTSKVNRTWGCYTDFDVIFFSHNIPKRNKLAEIISQTNP